MKKKRARKKAGKKSGKKKSTYRRTTDRMRGTGRTLLRDQPIIADTESYDAMKSVMRSDAFDSLTDKWQQAFLVYTAIVGSLSGAARQLNMSVNSHYNWMQYSLDGKNRYAEAFKYAMQVRNDMLEDEARRRAIRGVDRPVFQGGKEVGRIREYSDSLLIFLMKGHMPEKYAGLDRRPFTTTIQAGTESADGSKAVIQVTISGNATEEEYVEALRKARSKDPEALE